MTAPRPLQPLLRPLARAYGAAVARRNARFDRGEGVVRFDRPVISVGNLSVGGTGKTPMVRHIVQQLRGFGADPCIAMRGYGSSRRADGRSDEAEEYAEAFDDLPIVAQPQRAEGLIELFGTERGERVDAIVLDDGFQHRRIARDLDIVLLDATRDPGSDELLPLGRLREPFGSLARADAVVVTHAERAEPGAIEDLLGRCARLNPGLIQTVAEHAWTGLRVWERSAAALHDPGWLASRRAFVVCAIGNPEPFLAQAASACGSVAGTIVLRDHDPFAGRTVNRIRSEAHAADVILTTGKDWAKLGAENPDGWPCPVAVPELNLRLTRGEEQLTARISHAYASAHRDDTDTLAR